MVIGPFIFTKVMGATKTTLPMSRIRSRVPVQDIATPLHLCERQLLGFSRQATALRKPVLAITCAIAPDSGSKNMRRNKDFECGVKVSPSVGPVPVGIHRREAIGSRVGGVTAECLRPRQSGSRDYPRPARKPRQARIPMIINPIELGSGATTSPKTRIPKVRSLVVVQDAVSLCRKAFLSR